MGTIEGRTEASNSSIARPAGCRVGRAGPGVRGWRNGVGYGRLGCGYGRYGYGRWGYRRYGCGAAALTGAALGYLAVNYGYGYEEPYGYGNTSLYSYAPTNYAVSTPAPAARREAVTPSSNSQADIMRSGRTAIHRVAAGQCPLRVSPARMP